MRRICRSCNLEPTGCSLLTANRRAAQLRKLRTASSWRVDETYNNVKGKWTYLYRAVDRDGQTHDSLLSERRDLAAARRFFKKAVATNGVPEKVVIDKSGANLAGLQAVNMILKFTRTGDIIEFRQIKYLNHILEQDHQANDGLQSISFRINYHRGYRNSSHDPQEPVR